MPSFRKSDAGFSAGSMPITGMDSFPRSAAAAAEVAVLQAITIAFTFFFRRKSASASARRRISGSGARAVRRVFIIAKINEILARQVGAHVSEHADSADSGIEHTDRTILHRFTRFLLACSIRFMKSRPAAIREAAMGCGGFIPLPRSRAGRRRDTRSAYRRSRPASRSGG